MWRIVLLCILLNIPAANAQEQTQDSTASDNTNAEQNQKDEEIETPETFDPTEKISEDYAIPFPVDI